ncbi:MAG: hypothetical protein F4027_14570 [Rhodospirillaceae bacterium]|nr:hypothetical protein [Rhodospirillaceae bacterium]
MERITNTLRGDPDRPPIKQDARVIRAALYEGAEAVAREIDEAAEKAADAAADAKRAEIGEEIAGQHPEILAAIKFRVKSEFWSEMTGHAGRLSWLAEWTRARTRRD